MFNQILGSQIQQHTKRIIHHDKWNLFQEYKVGFTSEDQLTLCTTSIEQKAKMMW